jgi:hypothetical protein
MLFGWLIDGPIRLLAASAQRPRDPWRRARGKFAVADNGTQYVDC